MRPDPFPFLAFPTPKAVFSVLAAWRVPEMDQGRALGRIEQDLSGGRANN
jgi:hypothetical protein